MPAFPETLLHAILTLHEKIRTGEITRRPGTTIPVGEQATGGWVPSMPDAVRVATPR